MMRAAVLLFVLFAGILAAGVFAPEEAELLGRALALYRDLHAGRYEVAVLSSAVSNGRHVLQVEIRAAGQRFPARLTFPAESVRIVRPGNAVQLLGGGLWGAQYGRRIIGGLWLQVGAGWHDDGGLVWGGLGWQW